MTEDDREHRRVIAKHWKTIRVDDHATWAHQGNAWEPFVKTTWVRYRNNLPPPLGE